MNGLTTLRAILLLCVGSFVMGDDDENFESYDINSPCGQEIDLFHVFDTSVHAGKIDMNWYQTSSMLPGDPPCDLMIKGNYLFDRLAVKFTSSTFTYADCISTKEVHRLSFKGDAGIKDIEYSYKLCGKEMVRDKIFTTTAEHNFILRVMVSQTGFKSLSLTFNVFHTNGEYECDYGFFCENERCIPEDIECNPNNPCGDNSSCKQLTGWEILGVVAGCIAGLLLFCYCCCCCCKKSKSEGGEAISNNSPGGEEVIPLNDGQPALQTAGWSSATPDRDSNPTPVYVYVTASTQNNSNNPPSYSMLTNPHPQGVPSHPYDVRFSVTSGGSAHYPYTSGQSTGADATPSAPALDNHDEPPPPPSYDDVVAHGDKYKVT